MQPTRITADDFSWVDETGWYQVELEEFTLNFYFQASSTKRAFVFSPGWINRAEYSHPYFQRIKWLNDLDGIGISLSDPTLDLDDEVQIGWFVGTRTSNYSVATAAFLDRLFSHLGISRRQALFFGSSAGGFASLAFGAHLRGSHVLAVNPQTDITRFHELTELGKMTRATFGTFHLPAFPAMWWDRISIGHLWKTKGFVPHSTILMNSHDSWHMQNHIVPLLQASDSLEIDTDFALRLYSDAENGHNPPGADVLLPLMDQILTDAALAMASAR